MSGEMISSLFSVYVTITLLFEEWSSYICIIVILPIFEYEGFLIVNYVDSYFATGRCFDKFVDVFAIDAYRDTVPISDGGQ